MAQTGTAQYQLKITAVKLDDPEGPARRGQWKATIEVLNTVSQALQAFERFPYYSCSRIEAINRARSRGKKLVMKRIVGLTI
jgi:hypothetical protein